MKRCTTELVPCILWAIVVLAARPLPLAAQDTASLGDTASVPTNIERYSQLRRQRWQAFAPNLVIGQYAGNIGIASIGLGWSYGRRNQWETHLLLGVIPRYASPRTKATMTLRECFLPWNISLQKRPSFVRHPRTRIAFAPFSVSYAINTVFDHDFWTRQPERYPHGYYWFSTRLRSHFALGQCLSHTFTADNRWGLHGYSFYWEVSTTELDVIYKVQNHCVPWRDVIHLGAGVKLKML